MIDPSNRLRYLVEHDCFAICPMLSVRDFISFCKERGIETGEEQLERFEKLGILYPIARLKRPWVTHKIEFTDDGQRYLNHGLLEEGESWSGDTRSEWGRWRMRDAADELELLEKGHLWDPRNKPFAPWTTHRDADGTHTETYYSMFQVYPFEWKRMWLACGVDMSLFADGGDPEKIAQQMAEGITDRVTALHDPMPQDDIAFLAQTLSTRYYPLTQTDRRTFTLSQRRFRWDWYAYAQSWDAAACAAAFDIHAKDLADKQQTVAMIAQSRDPMRRWYQLVRFVAVDKKTELTDKAQYAQLLYAIESMFRMFSKDAFSVDLHPPDEGHTWKNEDVYGKGIPDDPHRHLEFVVNSYHLNPRPKLILVVEGPSEEMVIPRIAAEALGHNFSPLGIEVRALGGVGEYTGKKRYEKLGALEKFIDDYHFRQTPVVIILDREGRVEIVTKNLLGARSKLYPQRMLTKPKYVRIWTRSVEFDNFAHAEIAVALTTVAKGSSSFSEQEIAEARDAYDRKETDPLSALYLGKTSHDLDKIACLQVLADILIQSVRDNGLAAETHKRPLLDILNDAIEIAALNHQPVTLETWRINQESGYFGDLVTKKP